MRKGIGMHASGKENLLWRRVGLFVFVFVGAAEAEKGEQEKSN